MARPSQRCFCAFCRSQRVVYPKKHIGLLDVVLAAAAAFFLSQILYQDLDPKAAVFFALGLAIAEVFISVRRRLSVICLKCGFDPILYKRSPEHAASRVKEHMRRLGEDPLSVFSPPPKLPVIVKKKGMTMTSTGSSARSAEASR